MANLNVNKVILGGRLTADPELKQTASGISVTSFTMAIDRKYKKDGQKTTDFIDCFAWRNTAEFICKYFGKGSSIFLIGELQKRSYETVSGEKRYVTEVAVDDVYFVDSKGELGAQATTTPEYSSAVDADDFREIPTDDDLPF